MIHAVVTARVLDDDDPGDVYDVHLSQMVSSVDVVVVRLGDFCFGNDVSDEEAVDVVDAAAARGCAAPKIPMPVSHGYCFQLHQTIYP